MNKGRRTWLVFIILVLFILLAFALYPTERFHQDMRPRQVEAMVAASPGIASGYSMEIVEHTGHGDSVSGVFVLEPVNQGKYQISQDRYEIHGKSALYEWLLQRPVFLVPSYYLVISSSSGQRMSISWLDLCERLSVQAVVTLTLTDGTEVNISEVSTPGT